MVQEHYNSEWYGIHNLNKLLKLCLLMAGCSFYFIMCIPQEGGGLPYITDGDAHRRFQKKPLNVTILGVAPANFVP